jgi:uncharacterized membrane protein
MGHLLGLPSLLVLVSAALLAIGLTLLRQAVRGGTLPGCGGADAGCGAVTRGRWARLGPAPVALPGTLVYAAVFVSAVLVHPAVRPALPAGVAAAAGPVLVAAALTAAGTGAWLAAVQAVLIRQFCPYCMAAHTLAAVAAALAVGVAGTGPAGVSVAWAAGLVAAFAAGQCLLRPRLYAVTRVPTAAAAGGNVPGSTGDNDGDGNDGSDVRGDGDAMGTGTAGSSVTSDGRLAAGPASSPIPPAGRRVMLAGGNVTVSTADWPVLGPPDAPHVLALLADPTCLACRQMHRAAAETVALAGGWLAVVYVPVPMDPACNPAAAGRKARARDDVCAYARLTLAVHVAAPDAYPAFERWLLAQPQVPPVEEARRHAATLAPAAAAALALAVEAPPAGTAPSASPSSLSPDETAVAAEAVVTVARQKVALAVAAYQASRLTQVPALLLPAAAIAGQLPPPRSLLEVLARELGTGAGGTTGPGGAAASGATSAVGGSPLVATASPNPRAANPFATGVPIGGRPPGGRE